MRVLIDIDEDKFDLVQMAVVNGLKSSDMVYKAVAMGTIIDDNTKSKTKENKEECRE